MLINILIVLVFVVCIIIAIIDVMYYNSLTKDYEEMKNEVQIIKRYIYLEAEHNIIKNSLTKKDNLQQNEKNIDL